MILAIDDDPRVLELLARNLRKDGYTVVGAAGGNEGIRLARELHPFAITLDIRMPDRDGWSVLCELKADPALASIPVIVITVEENEKLGYVLGASDYLVKPISFKSLREILVKHQQAGRSCLVLVVDDDKGTRALLSESIRKAGWRVREAENGRVALDLLAEEKTDLILLDLMMPVMDGFEFLEELRSRKSSQFPPVVVVTAKDLTPQDVQRLEGNVLQVLHKGSYSLDDLVGEIRKRIVSCTQADKPGKE
jgi:DNA-binding response OmpR family regulator